MKIIVYWLISYLSASPSVAKDEYGFPRTTEWNRVEKTRYQVFDNIETATDFVIELKEFKEFKNPKPHVVYIYSMEKSIDSVWIEIKKQ